MGLFRDRHQAGSLLADKLAGMKLEPKLCVLALPRGGVPVAWEIAQRLNCPLDLLFIKKIGAPGQPELAIGAVSEDFEVHWREKAIEDLKIPPPELDDLADAKKMDLQAQIKKWRKGEPAFNVSGKTVIVVDDGLATGATMIAALQYLRKRNPKHIVVAVPVAARASVDVVAPWCDEIIVLHRPQRFFGVGQWYKDFTQVTDEEVQSLR